MLNASDNLGCRAYLHGAPTIALFRMAGSMQPQSGTHLCNWLMLPASSWRLCM